MNYQHFQTILTERGLNAGVEKERSLKGTKIIGLYLEDSAIILPLLENRLNDIKEELNLPIKIERFPNEEVIKIQIV